jgi:hypothetical protein
MMLVDQAYHQNFKINGSCINDLGIWEIWELKTQKQRNSKTVRKQCKSNLYRMEKELLFALLLNGRFIALHQEEPYPYGRLPHFMMVPTDEDATRTRTLHVLLEVLILDSLLQNLCVRMGK